MPNTCYCHHAVLKQSTFEKEKKAISRPEGKMHSVGFFIQFSKTHSEYSRPKVKVQNETTAIKKSCNLKQSIIMLS
jgi:hypothetical protein